MGPFASRQVILLPFPFSDLSSSKLRPALLLAPSGKGDWVLCQVTSRPYADAGAIALEPGDFSEGGLLLRSFARPGKLFTAHESLFQRIAGRIDAHVHAQVVGAIIAMLNESD